MVTKQRTLEEKEELMESPVALIDLASVNSPKNRRGTLFRKGSVYSKDYSFDKTPMDSTNKMKSSSWTILNQNDSILLKNAPRELLEDDNKFFEKDEIQDHKIDILRRRVIHEEEFKKKLALEK